MVPISWLWHWANSFCVPCSWSISSFFFPIAQIHPRVLVISSLSQLIPSLTVQAFLASSSNLLSHFSHLVFSALSRLIRPEWNWCWWVSILIWHSLRLRGCLWELIGQENVSLSCITFFSNQSLAAPAALLWATRNVGVWLDEVIRISVWIISVAKTDSVNEWTTQMNCTHRDNSIFYSWRLVNTFMSPTGWIIVTLFNSLTFKI